MVASGQSSILILKLILRYLMTTMAQERLGGLAFMSIEKEFSLVSITLKKGRPTRDCLTLGHAPY
jgi:hypothetical protein